MVEGVKRKFSQAMASTGQAEPRVSQFLPMFEHFRSELDEHHDRRERITKSSRDITASSKKIIFALQRVRTLNKPIPPDITKTIKPHTETIHKLLATITPDLQSINGYRYNRQISPGLQEYLEARIFQHYLETQTILTYSAATAELTALIRQPQTEHESSNNNTDGILLTPDDYLLGLFDATGEMMRFAITSMATSGSTASTASTRTVVTDLQELRLLLSNIEATANFPFPMSKAVSGKMAVMLASVDKVERALYGLTIRGSERPTGWVPDLSEAPGRPAGGLEVEG